MNNLKIFFNSKICRIISFSLKCNHNMILIIPNTINNMRFYVIYYRLGMSFSKKNISTNYFCNTNIKFDFTKLICHIWFSLIIYHTLLQLSSNKLLWEIFFEHFIEYEWLSPQFIVENLYFFFITQYIYLFNPVYKIKRANIQNLCRTTHWWTKILDFL